jgi:hypothetical protein
MLHILSWLLWHVGVACTDMRLMFPTVVYYVQSSLFFLVVATYSAVVHACHTTQVMKLADVGAISKGVMVIEPATTANVLRVLASLPATTIMNTRVFIPKSDCESFVKYMLLVLSGGIVVSDDTTRHNQLSNQLHYHSMTTHASRGLVVCCKTDGVGRHLVRAMGARAGVTHVQVILAAETHSQYGSRHNFASIENVFTTSVFTTSTPSRSESEGSDDSPVGLS